MLFENKLLGDCITIQKTVFVMIIIAEIIIRVHLPQDTI
jgi:hypothetical protein